MIAPAFCIRCKGRHRQSDDCPTHPRITFTRAPKPLESSGTTVRFSILPTRGGVATLEADWYSLPWELSPEAATSIFGFLEESRASVSAGGGRSYLRIKVRESVVEETKQFVGQVLANPKSWHCLTYRTKFAKDEVHVFGCNSKHEEVENDEL